MKKIEIKSVGYSYNSKLVLQDVNLSLNAGEILGIIGPNGSGKSTLLKCMNRILKPRVGSVLIDGDEINKLKMNDLAKKVGYVPQKESSKFPITVFDTILMGRKPHISWKPTTKDLQKVSDIIKMLNLEKISMRELDAISGGERQKVIIARALAQEPDIILLDEPTSNLDLKHQLEVLNLIKKQSENDLAVAVAIHDLNLAARYCDKFIMLKEGIIHAIGGQEILGSKNLEYVYDVKVSIVENLGKKFIIPECPA